MKNLSLPSCVGLIGSDDSIWKERQMAFMLKWTYYHNKVSIASSSFMKDQQKNSVFLIILCYEVTFTTSTEEGKLRKLKLRDFLLSFERQHSLQSGTMSARDIYRWLSIISLSLSLGGDLWDENMEAGDDNWIHHSFHVEYIGLDFDLSLNVVSRFARFRRSSSWVTRPSSVRIRTNTDRAAANAASVPTVMELSAR